MKRIIVIALSALAALFVSCDMNTLPYTAIDESTAIQGIDDATNMRISIYTPVKSLFGGGRLDIEEIRGGMFNAMADFGNYYGLYYQWNMQTNDSDAESLWYSDYSIIGSMNYIIGSFTKLVEGDALDEEEKEIVNMYISEAYMTRVMAYWDLVTKYCVAYDPATAANTDGLPLQLEYAPTSDSSKYPGRNTLEETYNQLLLDLEKAAAYLPEGQKNYNYWSQDAVKAMRARVHLNMKNYTEAATIAQELINSGTYQLAASAAEIESMWRNDIANENIFLVAANLQDLCTSTGSYYIYDNNARDGSTPDPQYIPSQTLIDLYEDGDYRYATYFKTREITVQGAATDNLEIFFKYEGNPALRSSPTQINYVSAGKPFRIAEQYLILAEACANIEGQTQTGVKALNDLRAARIENAEPVTVADGRALLDEVKKEWSRECVGEGFRMINMKRWGDGVKRAASQNSAMTYPGDRYDGLNKPITDSRCVWPIPKTEIDANPQIKGQQNPGY
ncbi:MAG: RagB/SusD family nutrient uptake outer membrane protein [Tidjanibacter sp.]|nr:RagB/SusD family nutrient uptake outer membrane protein [Tidjanibacter sp.]